MSIERNVNMRMTQITERLLLLLENPDQGIATKPNTVEECLNGLVEIYNEFIGPLPVQIPKDAEEPPKDETEDDEFETSSEKLRKKKLKNRVKRLETIVGALIEHSYTTLQKKTPKGKYVDLSNLLDDDEECRTVYKQHSEDLP